MHVLAIETKERKLIKLLIMQVGREGGLDNRRR